MMNIGCDTGVLIAALYGHQRIAEICARFPNEFEVLLVFSSISIFELLAHSFRLGRAEEGRGLIHELHAAPWVQLVPIRAATAERAAGLKHGLGLHASDALILAALVEAQCEVMLTKDRHFEIAAQQGLLRVEFL